MEPGRQQLSGGACGPDVLSDAIDIEHALEGVQLRRFGRLRGAQRGQLIDPPSKLVDVACQLRENTPDRIELTLQCVEDPSGDFTSG